MSKCMSVFLLVVWFAHVCRRYRFHTGQVVRSIQVEEQYFVNLVLIISQSLRGLGSDLLCAPYITRFAYFSQNTEADMRPIVVVFTSIRLKTKQYLHQIF
jgi:hypothetical protein